MQDFTSKRLKKKKVTIKNVHAAEELWILNNSTRERNIVVQIQKKRFFIHLIAVAGRSKGYSQQNRCFRTSDHVVSVVSLVEIL